MHENNILGDVVISIETLLRTSEGKDKDFLIQLLVHGVLHLHDYDHERGEEEAEKMFKKEAELIAILKASL